jgi:hypothetical protein
MFMPDILGATLCVLLYIEPGPPMPGPPRPTTPIGPPLLLTHLQQNKSNFNHWLAFHGLKLQDQLNDYTTKHTQYYIDVCD